ncbi:MAG: SGNH/GDSL hydrolase family protein [Syntrophobacterales bacterium]|nr:SGNH/GDSL hydrolase family protein [Syntrophobacterales bacterium]
MKNNRTVSPAGTEKTVLIAGAILILTALAVNEWTLTLWTCPTGGFAGDDRLRIVVFQALCLIGGAGLIVYRKRPITINILLLTGTLLACFSLGELVLRLFYPQIGGRSEQEIFFAYHDTLGWQFIPGKTGVLVSKHEYENLITINSAGMRDREYPLDKSPGKRRVAVLGDSFTAGLGVKEGEVFTEVLENSLGEKTEVLNFGINGFGPTQEYLLLKDRVLSYQPDLVLMVFYIGNDFDDTTNLSAWIDGYERPRAVLDKTGRVVFTNIPVPKTSRPRNERQRTCSLPRSHLIDFFDRIIHQRQDKYALDVLPPEVRLCRKDTDPAVAAALPLLREILRETDSLCRRHGSRFALVLAPTVAQIYDQIYWERIKKVYQLRDDNFDLFHPNKLLSGIGAELGIPVLDLTPELLAAAARGAELYYYKNRHWNAAGHRAAARAIYSWLQQNKLLTQ